LKDYDFFFLNIVESEPKLRLPRYDAEPNPLQTWWEVEKLSLSKQSNLSK
ncbi:unnamed protein product, partial [marine sediment metagenome]